MSTPAIPNPLAPLWLGVGGLRPPVSLTHRFLRRSFHISRWDKFAAAGGAHGSKTGLVQRTAAGRSSLDKQKHTVLSVCRYGGSPKRKDLSNTFRKFAETTPSAALRVACEKSLSIIGSSDMFTPDESDLEFFALYLNATIACNIAPKSEVLDKFLSMYSDVSHELDEEHPHQAVESILCALLQLSLPTRSLPTAVVLYERGGLLRSFSQRVLASPMETSMSMRSLILHAWVQRFICLCNGDAASSSPLDKDVAIEMITGLIASIAIGARTMSRTEYFYVVKLLRQLVKVCASPRSHDATATGGDAGVAPDAAVAARITEASAHPLGKSIASHREHFLCAALPWIQGASLAECVDAFDVFLFMCRDGVAQDDSLDLLVHELMSMTDLPDPTTEVADLLFAFESCACSGAACTQRFRKLPTKWRRILGLSASDVEWSLIAQRWASEVGGDAVTALQRVAFLRPLAQA